jgi:VWFA-related protein
MGTNDAAQTKDDFIVTEDRKPQRIFSFEPPQTQGLRMPPDNQNSSRQAPLSIFVLDQLNSSFEDFAFIRYEFRQFLLRQPSVLGAPAELAVVGNRDLEVLQGFTRSRADLLYALDHLGSAIPYKWLSDAFAQERFDQTVGALQQLALQSSGIPGGKSIIWVGHGFPGFTTLGMPPDVQESLRRYMHDTATMLINARISLFVIYPGLKVGHFVNFGAGPARPVSAAFAESSISDDSDPFAASINFGVLVNEAGGKLFYNRNDVDAEILGSQITGSQYYTLTYQPPQVASDGKFHRIRVELRDSALRAMTRAGYFAPDSNAPVDSLQQSILNLNQAMQSEIPFQSLDLKIDGIVRHPDSHTFQFVVQLKGRNLDWQAGASGASTASVLVSAASLNTNGKILALKEAELMLRGATHDKERLDAMVTPIQFTLRLPLKTDKVHVAVEAEPSGKIGVAHLAVDQIYAARTVSTPEPHLSSRPVN